MTNKEINQTVQEQKSLNDMVQEFLEAFRKFWFIAVALMVIAGVLGFFYYKKTYTPEYTAESTISITAAEYNTTDRSHTNNNQLAESLSVSFNYLINNEVFYEVLKNDLGTNYVPGTIEIAAIEKTNIISIKVIGGNPDLVFETLKSVMKNYSSVSEFVIGDTKLTVLEKPTMPKEPDNPFNPLKYIVIFAFLGFVVGLIPTVIQMFFVKTIKSGDDIKKYLNVPFLGSLPAVYLGGKKDDENQPCSILNKNVGFRYIESMRSTTSRCEREFKQNDAKVIMVTSTRNGEGKTSFALNLAYSLSKNQNRVMLIDGDLRNPDIFNNIDDKSPDYSMEDFLKGKIKSKQAVINLEGTRVIALVPNKPSKNPVDNINSKDMSKFIKDARQVVDYVIIDTPPCGKYADAAAFAQYCDGVVYVVKEDGARVNNIIDTLQGFSFTRKPILGCVLNGALGVRGWTAGYGNSYKYGKYGYGKYGYGKYGYGRRRYGYGYGQYGYGYGYGYGYRGKKDGAYGDYGEVSDREFRASTHATTKHIKLSTTEEELNILEEEKKKEAEAKAARMAESEADKADGKKDSSKKDSDKKADGKKED